MHFILSEDKRFGFMWDVSIKGEHWVYGVVQVIIENKVYPEFIPRVDYYDLTTIFGNLKASFKEDLYYNQNDSIDFGEKEFDIELYNNDELEGVFDIETSYLGMRTSDSYEIDSLILCIGYSGNTERLFYSFNHGESFDEVRYERGTIKSVIMKLPDNKMLMSLV